MAILSKGTDFTTGDQVTAAKLDALVDNATFASGAVDDSTTQLDASGRVIVKDGGVTISKLSTGGPQWNSDGQVAIKGDALSIEGKGTNAGLEINSLVTGDGVAFIDFHFDASTEPDYDARIANDSSKNFILQNASHGKDCIIQTTKSDGTLVNGLKVDSEGSVTCTNNVIVDNGLADGGQVQFNSQGNNSLSIDNNAGNLRVLNETTASELVRVEAGGDVGIGTNDPSSKLHVVGAIKATSGTNDVELTNGSIEISRAVASDVAAFIDFKADSSEDFDCRIAQNNDDGLAFSTGGHGSVGERVTILKDGKVGIGTTTPGSELEVAGTIEFDGLSGTGAVSVTDILDEDTLSSNSATALATQQSIKAYIDSFAFKYHGTGEATVTTTTSFTDLDLSSIIGSNRALVVLKVRNSSTTTNVWFRAKDDDFDWQQSDNQFAYGCNGALAGTSDRGSYLVTMTNASGVVEHRSEESNKDVKVTVMAFQKLLT